MMTKIIIDHEKCASCDCHNNSGCGCKCDCEEAKCVDVCPAKIFIRENNKTLTQNTEDCTLCRACESSCPMGAIKVEEE
jgi:NAD-dependent dihydropyrimidine dehydrogenase PreA subunit